MDQVLKDQKLLQLNQDEIDNLKSSITIKEIKVIFFKSSWERNFHIQMEFYQVIDFFLPENQYICLIFSIVRFST